MLIPISSGEEPSNSQLMSRLAKAPCWREIFTKVRAERVSHRLEDSTTTSITRILWCLFIFFAEFASDQWKWNTPAAIQGGTSQVSVIMDHVRRLIPNAAVFVKYGFDSGNVKVITDDKLFDWFPRGPDLTWKTTAAPYPYPQIHSFVLHCINSFLLRFVPLLTCGEGSLLLNI